METWKISWSGGKDSTASLLLHLQSGHNCIAVCYIPMFTEEIPLLYKSHYNFLRCSAERFRLMGASVNFVYGRTYVDCVKRLKTKGDDIGSCIGFPPPITGRCYFNSEKIKALDSFKCNFDFLDIGIAFDEPSRAERNLTPLKRSILYENKLTEFDAKMICINNNFLSPLYDIDNRDGCTLCPNANKYNRLNWYLDYPQARDILIDLENYVKEHSKKIYAPLRKNLWFSDEWDINQISIEV